MTKHDAAINLVEAIEAIRRAKSFVSNEAEVLLDFAMLRIKTTGDALYPDIIEEMYSRKTDPMA